MFTKLFLYYLLLFPGFIEVWMVVKAKESPLHDDRKIG